jgi:hypothetical protein
LDGILLQGLRAYLGGAEMIDWFISKDFESRFDFFYRAVQKNNKISNILLVPKHKIEMLEKYWLERNFPYRRNQSVLYEYSLNPRELSYIWNLVSWACEADGKRERTKLFIEIAAPLAPSLHDEQSTAEDYFMTERFSELSKLMNGYTELFFMSENLNAKTHMQEFQKLKEYKPKPYPIGF